MSRSDIEAAIETFSRVVGVAVLGMCLSATAAGATRNTAPADADDAAQPSADAAATVETGPGTTIVGDQESPIGLYITPWKNEYAERSLDRPARFVDEENRPIDRDVFQRQVEYYDTITEYRKARLATGGH